MWLLRAALRRPITVIVFVIAIALCSILALVRMPVDIFPNLNLPVIYVAQPFGGMSPAQMEGYLVYYYEYHFLYITGIESVESKSIQNVGLVKLTFQPGTDMSQAAAQTVGYVDRARAFMPPGTVAPFVLRFDAGSVPVGYLVFSSPTRTVGEIQDVALNRGSQDQELTTALATSYQLVPQGLSFQLFADRQFHEPSAFKLETRGLADGSITLDDTDVARVKVLPVYVTMLVNRGRYLASHARHEQAIEAYQQALGLGPDSTIARQSLADSQRALRGRRD